MNPGVFSKNLWNYFFFFKAKYCPTTATHDNQPQSFSTHFLRAPTATQMNDELMGLIYSAWSKIQLIKQYPGTAHCETNIVFPQEIELQFSRDTSTNTIPSLYWIKLDHRKSKQI